MNKIDIVMMIYVTFMILATVISVKYGSAMIKKTGLFLPQTLIAGTVNLVLGVFGIIGWLFYSWGVNEFLFFGGLVSGVGLLVVGEVVLLSILFSRRNKWIQIYHDSLNGSSR
ncbi:hypothetical protein SAMN04487944_1224 [Gracilibacillus ureilyticus]|uniref:Uncharacterized protein n=1 Tax=Gracilibacillus ureilyticus TaxID=531814 RepID=A0A1H9V7M0_9BACI|nr:hypothetical protein [Gracilibacillus ureilyticus]SES17840.1 hypothetical protein SAMN04487944_1224 [Gracilibacillus ureilyticus]